MPKNGSYPLLILGFVLCTNSSLFRFKIMNKHCEFRNYLMLLLYQEYVKKANGKEREHRENAYK